MSDMGSRAPVGQSPRKDQAIVAFDFDGTLTIRDSFTEFLRWRAGRGGWALGLVKLAPAVAGYARDRDRGRIKAASVREFLRGVPRAELEALLFQGAAAPVRVLSGWRRSVLGEALLRALDEPKPAAPLVM